MPAHPHDAALEAAIGVVERARDERSLSPIVKSFFDEATFTVTHVVRAPGSKECVIIDSVLDFDLASGSTSESAALRVSEYVQRNDLEVVWLLETHVHADHLSAAPSLQKKLGGRLAIGREITTVQQTFGKVFNAGTPFARDGSQFDHLFADGESFRLGGLEAIALHVPGHTPACMAYVIGDAVFPGDTLFMPDYGTARCDFPGGDSSTLFQSIHRLLNLPAETRVFLCHDYKAPGRDQYAWETTIEAQRRFNVHVHEGVSLEDFVAMRDARDVTLSPPRLMLPSVQVNMRGGNLPEPEDNGVHYLKIPLNLL
jgi:glyoxylase-like metal-dependent hydrolase (beta-lactamase superfamily II)